MKKKMIAVVVGSAIIGSIFSSIPIQAATSQSVLEQVQEYGIDITGLSAKEIQKKLKESKKEWSSVKKRAEDLGVNVSGLTLEQAIHKVNAAQMYVSAELSKGKNNELEAMLSAVKAIIKDDKKALLKVTDDLEAIMPGISSLSYEDAKEAIIQGLKEYGGVDITTLSISEAQSQVKVSIIAGLQKEADFFGVNISGLSFQQAQKVLNKGRQQYLMKEFEQLYAIAAKYDIDVSGLSKEAAWELVKQAEMDNQGMEEEKSWEEVNKLAVQYGINVSGLNKDEAWTKIEEYILQELKQYAQENGIDITGLSSEEIKEKVNTQRSAIDQAVLEEEAARFGVDITGLSNKEAWELVKNTELKQYAEKYEVDVNGLSMDEAWRLIKEEAKKKGDPTNEEATRLEQLKSQAAEYNIDTTGLTEEEIQAKIDEATEPIRYRLYLEDQARAFLFDPTGMTNEEIVEKLDEAMAQSCLEDAARVGLQEAIEAAKSMGIDPTGLTTAEITEKICEVIRYNQMHDSLQAQANAMNISIAGMTNDEAQSYILQVDQERRDAADAERNARQDAEREAARRAEEEKDQAEAFDLQIDQERRDAADAERNARQDAESAARLEEARAASGNPAAFDAALAEGSGW